MYAALIAHRDPITLAPTIGPACDQDCEGEHHHQAVTSAHPRARAQSSATMAAP
jgi:hypothetical protein